jgi:serine/threonine protein kinase
MTEAPRAKAVFLDALELQGDEREMFVAESCAGDDALRQRVDALLAADGRVDDVLGRTAEVPGYGHSSVRDGSSIAGAFALVDLSPGDRVGPFLLEEKLGVGGFGVVFRASQEEPVRRQVALKVIKLGMDTRSVMARFELERQALALMDHPNIARVFDAGATDSGRPYFVMELVMGVPITDHCERDGLGLGARLRLFASVCRAVQHAHQRGVLHRDLKPSNVLVSQVDGHDQPKVIDFGIAKATRGDITDSSLVTHEGHLLGTPDYMSPEQAEGAADIDTRADVYSLGVLLYELLCGERPFDARGRSLPDVLRTICEEDPQPPSARVGGSRGSATGFDVPRELDWVVLRCLEKERDRRYATANELANEVGRYLDHEPLLAAPPSTWYRVGKLVKRHRAATTAVIGITIALVVGAIGTGIGLLRADSLNSKLTTSLGQTEQAIVQLDASLAETRALNSRLDEALADMAQTNTELDAALAQEELTNQQLDVALVDAQRQAAIAKAVNDFLAQDLLGAARPTGAANQGPDMPIGRLIDVAAVELDVASAPGGRFVDKPLVEASLRYTLGTTYDTLGSFDESVRHMSRCVELRREHLGAEDLETLDALSFLGSTQMRQGEWTAAVLNAREAYEGLREHHGLEHADTLASVARFADALRRAGDSDEGFALLMEALPVAEDVHGGGAPVTTDLGAALAIQYCDRGRFAEAETLYQNVIVAQVGVFGPQSPVVLNSKMNLATVLRAQGRTDESLQHYLEVIAVQRRVEGDDHPNVLNTLFNIAECLRSMGKLDEAEKVVSSGVPTAERVFGPGHPKTLMWLGAQAGIHQQRGDVAAAVPVFGDVMQRYEAAFGPGHPSTLESMGVYARALFQVGRQDESLDLFDRAHAGWVELQGVDGARAIEARLMLGAVHRLLERFDAAERALRSAHESAQRAFGSDHALTWESAASLSLIYSLRDESARAEPLVESAAPLAAAGKVRALEAWNAAVQQLALSWERAGNESAAQRWWTVAQGGPVR